MKPLFSLCSLVLMTVLSTVAPSSGQGASGAQLAAQLRERQQAGTAYARIRLEGVSGSSDAVQVQIKSRGGKGEAVEMVYQILWPKERKGESALLRRTSGGAISGAYFVPPDKARTLGAGQLNDPLFGSALTWEDVIDDPLTWDHQAIVGTETVNRAECQILESKGSKGSSYASVRTWVDTRRMIPMKIEKYGSGGKLVRLIETTRVVSDDTGKPVPATLTVQGPGGLTTRVEGGKIRHGLSYAGSEFTPEGIRETAIPKGSPE